MKPLRMAAPILRHNDDWRAILSLSAYRFLIAFGLIAILSVGDGASIFEPSRPALFRVVCLAYLAACVVGLGTALLRRPRLGAQVIGATAMDIVSFVLLAYASIGAAGGLGMLLIAPLAAAGMLLPLRTALLLASMATLGMLGQEVLHSLVRASSQGEFVQGGILGGLYFSAAGLSHWLARQVRLNEALAADHASEARDLAELNRRIIEHMQIGAIVVETDGRIRTVNQAAIELLNANDSPDRIGNLAALSPAVDQALRDWLTEASPARRVIHSEGRALLPLFSRLGAAADAPALIFIEDARRQSEQAQQIKLMSLGRLAASIAHEIRNPLGAIGHAGQLLAESEALGAGETRLLDIVQRHVRRIDTIIGSVLGLSRRNENGREAFGIDAWLDEAIADYAQSCPQPPVFHITPQVRNLRIVFDPGQLRQVLFNLWENAQRYARQPDTRLEITLAASVNRNGETVLDVTDNGPGIASDDLEQVLEPFFTTARDGTGLGLHIAREICEANGAQIAAVAGSAGACFRIVFASVENHMKTIMSNASQARP